MRFFYLDRDPQRVPVTGQTVLLSVEESHHLLHVLRAERRENLQLVDGLGYYYSADFAGKAGRRVRLKLNDVRHDGGETNRPQLLLACAVVRGKRFEWALEKAVELGAHRIQPLCTERGVIRPGAGRQQRWLAILRAALKQAGRAFMPELAPALELTACLDLLVDTKIYFGDCRRPGIHHDGSENRMDEAAAADPAPLLSLLLSQEGGLLPAGLANASSGALNPAPPAWLAWFVGPEGGWGDAERSALLAAAGHPISLGPHRLRTETAAVAGLGLLQAGRQVWAGQGT